MKERKRLKEIKTRRKKKLQNNVGLNVNPLWIAQSCRTSTSQLLAGGMINSSKLIACPWVSFQISLKMVNNDISYTRTICWALSASSVWMTLKNIMNWDDKDFLFVFIIFSLHSFRAYRWYQSNSRAVKYGSSFIALLFHAEDQDLMRY